MQTDIRSALVAGEAAHTGAALTFSFVIANYNYARFVRRAIESALGQEWPHVEIVVVDDGSTDGSRGVIRSYGDKITAIFQANAGQRAANNAGFARSFGDVVVFLDADDVLEPGFAREVAAVWRPGISKVQVQMARVDAAERKLGSLVPDIACAPSPEEIRRWATMTSEYPTPPGSGNAYARTFLERFFPIGGEHDAFTDSTCLALAPFLGDVVTVAKPLVLYRQHGDNDSNLLADRSRFAREVDRAYRRQHSAETICRALGTDRPQENCIRRGLHLLQLRIASLRINPSIHPVPGESRLTMLRDLAVSLKGRGFEPFGRRLRVAAWSLLALILPRGPALRLIRWRFSTR